MESPYPQNNACHPIAIGFSGGWNLFDDLSFREAWNLTLLTEFQPILSIPAEAGISFTPLNTCHSSGGWNLSHCLLFSESGNLSILPISIYHPIAIGSSGGWNLPIL